MKRKRATVVAIHENSHPGPPRLVPSPLVVLQELFELLEEYAPVWYTEELHERAMAALSAGERPPTVN